MIIAICLVILFCAVPELIALVIALVLYPFVLIGALLSGKEEK